MNRPKKDKQINYMKFLWNRLYEAGVVESSSIQSLSRWVCELWYPSKIGEEIYLQGISQRQKTHTIIKLKDLCTNNGVSYSRKDK